MKKLNKRHFLPLALSAALVLGTGTSLAAVGDENDPLISLSYLQQTVLPNILTQVETNTLQQQQQLSADLSAQISQYKTDIQALVSSDSTGSDSYTLVTLSKGQTLYLNVGCEMMLRVGSATVNAATSPALIDVTTGGTINNGTALTKNHLYMSTIPDRTLTPDTDTVKLLMRGSYSIV